MRLPQRRTGRTNVKAKLRAGLTTFVLVAVAVVLLAILLASTTVGGPP
jgi:hypothetical protein